MSFQRQLILAVVTDVNHTTVTYPGCTQCYTKLLVDPTTQRYHCIKCGVSIPDQSVRWRYRLVLTVADNTASCKVAVFGQTLDAFFGKIATDFHRSLTSLDKSGYPAEHLLSVALLKTFNGKYFYFGLKLPPDGLGRAPTLSDAVNNVASRSILNSTGVMEHPHVLVYQMIASNDGVYATVSDFIRFSIKQIRKEITTKADSDSTWKIKSIISNIPQKNENDYSLNNNDSDFYKSVSLHSKQNSVAFSFESLAEGSSDKENDSTECEHFRGNSQTFVEEVVNDCKSIHHGISSVTIDSTEWSAVDEDWLQGFDKKTDGILKYSFLNNQYQTEFTNESFMLSDVKSVKQKLNFSNHMGNADSDFLNEEIDKNSMCTGMKVNDSCNRKPLHGNRCMSIEDFSESPFTKSFDVNILNASICSISCRKDIERPSTEYQLPEHKKECIEVCDLENILNMPDSEGLQTFLEDNSEQSYQLCIASNVKNTNLVMFSSVKSNHLSNSAKNPTENLDTDLICIPDSEEIFLESENKVLQCSNGRNDNSPNLNELDLPDSQDLEAFLESFDDSLSMVGITEECSNRSFKECHAGGCVISKDILFNSRVEDKETCEGKHVVCEITSDGLMPTTEYDSLESFVNHKQISMSSNHGKVDLYCDIDRLDGELQTSQDIPESMNKDEERRIGPKTTYTCDYETITDNNSDSGLQMSSSTFDLFSSVSSGDSCPSMINMKRNCQINKTFDKTNKDEIEVQGNVVKHKIEELNSLDDAFDETWLELLDGELDISLSKLNQCVAEVSMLVYDKTKNDENLLNSIDIKTHSFSEKKFTKKDEDEKKSEATNFENQLNSTIHSNFDTSEILFDSPEVAVFHPRVMIQTPVKAKSDTTVNSVNNLTKETPIENHLSDEDIIVESQSSFFECERSSFQTRGDQFSTLEDMKQVRKVVFSKKLRRVSSCRLMDIKMREHRSPLVSGFNVLKSCLKQSNQVINTSDKPTKKESVIDEYTNTYKMLTTDNEVEMGVDDSIFIASSQMPTHTLGRPPLQIVHVNNETKSSSCKDTSNLKGITPCTPDPFITSFDDSSFDINSELDRPLLLETPIRSDDPLIKDVSVCVPSVFPTGQCNSSNTNSRNIPMLSSACTVTHQNTPDNTNPITEILIVDSETGKENKDKTSKGKNSMCSRLNKGGPQRKAFACVVGNTPGCDKTSPTCDKPVVDEDIFSPDLFEDSYEELVDCDKKQSFCNMPSVLCKQLFY